MYKDFYHFFFFNGGSFGVIVNASVLEKKKTPTTEYEF